MLFFTLTFHSFVRNRRHTIQYDANSAASGMHLAALLLLTKLSITGSIYSIEPPEDCAVRCKNSSYNPANWCALPAAYYFVKCDWLPTLFDYNLNDTSPTMLRACMDSDEEEAAKSEVEAGRRFDARLSRYNVEVSFKLAENSAFVVPGKLLEQAWPFRALFFKYTFPTSQRWAPASSYMLFGQKR
jgi:hypothetical protein